MAARRPLVLVCDDEPHLRELVRASLGAGYRYVDAATVGEAEETLRAATPDAVVLDLMLPGGSGIDVLRSIRRVAGRGPRVVVVSAWSTGDYRRAADEAGADAFVAKPFMPDELAAIVARLLAERR